ncbi:MAG: signal peptidase II [Ruminococcaceae bacterium]|nr:signal peptidase II [Oscillospiraceae bacterium]
MKLKNSTFYGLCGILMALSIALDQLTKHLTVTHLKMYEDGGSILGLFRITRRANPGAAWSILEGKTWLFVLILVVFLALLGICIWKKWIHKRFELLCLAAIAGGGIGNGLDRIFRSDGMVVDMIQFSFWPEFPTFNVADCFITVGCIALVIYVLLFDRTEPKKHPE